MNTTEYYTELPGRVVDSGNRFEHMMAIALDPKTGHKEGLVRCIVKREGDVSIGGYIDHSMLYSVSGNDALTEFTIGKEIIIEGYEAILNQMGVSVEDCIGLEDPDLYRDEESGLLHLYFTLPIRNQEGGFSIHLGHAVGADIHSLQMTMPVLYDWGDNTAKELSIAPVNSKGIRYNLIESNTRGEHFSYSTVRAAIARDMGEPWEFGPTLFNPVQHTIGWIAGHASPGSLLPRSFIDIGEGKLLGFLNGREASQKVLSHTLYGMFSVGLFVYDYEEGIIEWVSPEPLIKDSEARTITFSSQFVETDEGKGILYAHVDDSFVRAYSVEGEKLRQLLPAKYR